MLLSVSENSSYSNQDVQKKKVDFDNKPIYDSLKLAKIFYLFKPDKTVKWNEEMIKKHQEEMIGIIDNHYKSSDSCEIKTTYNKKI